MVKKRAGSRRIAKSNSSSFPIGVRIISILFYVRAIFGILIGLALAIGGSVFVRTGTGQAVIQEVSAQLGANPSILTSTNLTALFVGFGIVFLILGIVEMLIARGLWRGKQWARIVTIILMVLAVINSIGELFQGNVVGGMFDLIISAFIVLYLSFSERVRKIFA